MQKTPWGIHIGDYFHPERLDIPVIIPSDKGGFFLHYQEEDADIAENFLESVILNWVAFLPLGMMHIHLWDYANHKRFPYLVDLQSLGILHLAQDSDSAERAFNKIESLCRSRHFELLTKKNYNLFLYNQNVESAAEPYHLVIINGDDYPDQRTSLRRLQSTYTAAADAGIYFLTFSTKLTEERQDAGNYLRKISPKLSLQNGKLIIPDLFKYQELGEWYDFEMLNINKDYIISVIHNQAQLSKQESVEKDYLTVPIGKKLNGKDSAYFSLGGKSGNHHALLTGGTGTGKSVFLNNLILRIGEHYSAKEFRLFLMDYKKGVEFQAFKNHPNVEKIFLDNTDIDAAEKLLTDFVDLCEQRSQLFKKIGVENIEKYNAAFPNSPIARTLLIIDEFQKMFGDFHRKQRINKLLDDIARQGRAFGIHMLLTTQNLSGTPLNEDVRSEIGLRMTFRLNNRDAARSIMQPDNIDMPMNLEKYQLLYNQKAGQQLGNVIFRTDPPEDIDLTIARIRQSRPQNECITPEIVKSKMNSEINGDDITAPQENQPQNHSFNKSMTQTISEKSDQTFDNAKAREILNKINSKSGD